MILNKQSSANLIDNVPGLILLKRVPAINARKANNRKEPPEQDICDCLRSIMPIFPDPSPCSCVVTFGRKVLENYLSCSQQQASIPQR